MIHSPLFRNRNILLNIQIVQCESPRSIVSLQICINIVISFAFPKLQNAEIPLLYTNSTNFVFAVITHKFEILLIYVIILCLITELLHLFDIDIIK